MASKAIESLLSKIPECLFLILTGGLHSISMAGVLRDEPIAYDTGTLGYPWDKNTLARSS